MPKIYHKCLHALSFKEAAERLQQALGKLEKKYGLIADWEEEGLARIACRGIAGTLKLSPGKVLVNINLPFLLIPLKGKIEANLGHELERLLG